MDFIHDVKRSLRADPSKPIRRAYNETYRRHPANDSDEDDCIPEFPSVRSSLARKRQTLFPPIPRRVRDVMITGRWKKNWNGQDMVSHQDSRKGIVIMMSSRNASSLLKCRDLYIDGTFKTCPKPFLQVISIHGMFHGRVIPFAFVLLKSKATTLYREMFDKLKQTVRRFTGHNLHPARILCDFEASLIKAIEHEFPNTTIAGTICRLYNSKHLLTT